MTKSTALTTHPKALTNC